jgi:hypothetical protein
VDKSKEANIGNVRDFLKANYLDELIAINQRTGNQD